MHNAITTNKETLYYLAEQVYIKGYSAGKKCETIFNIEDVVKSVGEQFAKDVDRFSLAKPIKKSS